MLERLVRYLIPRGLFLYGAELAQLYINALRVVDSLNQTGIEVPLGLVSRLFSPLRFKVLSCRLCVRVSRMSSVGTSEASSAASAADIDSSETDGTDSGIGPLDSRNKGKSC